MIYLQLSLLALGAILLNYNLMISMLCIVIFLLITWKNKNLNARKTIICLIVFLAFFIRGAYEQKTNISHLKNVENNNLELVISDKFNVNVLLLPPLFPQEMMTISIINKTNIFFMIVFLSFKILY